MSEAKQKRLIFFDTEFTDFINTELISIGLVTDDGHHSFYAELDDYNPKLCSEFVRNVVLPELNPEKYRMKRAEAAARLFCWLEELEGEYVLCPDYMADWELFADLVEVLPPNIHPSPLMFYPMLNQIIMQKATELQTPDVKWFFEQAKKQYSEGFLEYFLRNPKPRQHHAGADAKAIRQGFLKSLEWLGSHGY